MKTVGLFAGIGGFELGLKKHGFETTLLCENYPPAIEVLKHRFPNVPIVEDICKLGTLPKDTELVCAGFPCQNLSSVGGKSGIKGEQSSLVGEVFRLLSLQQVPWVIIENVKFMLHLQKGLAMRHIIDSLESLGYRWAYRVLNSQYFGVPQRRERVFIVASLHGNPWDVLFPDNNHIENEKAQDVAEPVGFYWTEGRYATGLAANAVPPLKGGSTVGIPSPPAILFPDGLAATPDIRDAERLQGFPSDWTKKAAINDRPSCRWKLVGNAVTVNVAAWLGDKLSKPGHFDPSQNCPLNGKWPHAAWGSKKEGRYEVKIGSAPSAAQLVKLDSFLKYPPKQLSARAASGFLSRARAGNLRYPKGFLEGLNEYNIKLNDQTNEK